MPSRHLLPSLPVGHRMSCVGCYLPDVPVTFSVTMRLDVIKCHIFYSDVTEWQVNNNSLPVVYAKLTLAGICAYFNSLCQKRAAAGRGAAGQPYRGQGNHIGGRVAV